MEIVDNTVLRFALPHSAADRILSHIDRAALTGLSDTHKEIALFWGEAELQNAAYLLDHTLPPNEVPRLPTLLERDYKWPGVYKPFAHQTETAAFLSIRRRAFCFSEAGTGKTSAAIWAADYLMERRSVTRALVICPLSIMQSAWQADLFRTAMHRSVAVAYGSADKRRKIVTDPYEFVIINYDGIETVFDTIREQNFDLIIVDECFAAGTLVATPTGSRPIEQLQAGDVVLTSSGAARIKTLVRNLATRLVKVALSDGTEITCTPDHPFFTDLGWVTAEHLAGREIVSHADMPHVRGNIPLPHPHVELGQKASHRHWADLHAILRTEEVPCTESGDIVFSQDAGV